MTNKKNTVENASKMLIKVSPRISVFLGGVRSRQGKDELALNHGADRDSVNAGVELLPKHLQKKLRDHTVGIRDIVKNYSIPYSDGVRVMKASKYPEMIKQLDQKIATYKIFVVDEIIGNYDSIKNLAKVRLNGLYNDKMFPNKEVMAEKYGAKIIVEPLSLNDSNFLIDGLDENQINEIKENVRKELEENLIEGQKRVIQELRSAIANILEKTKNEDGARYKGAINNLIEQCNKIDSTNVLEISELTSLTCDIKKKFGNVTANGLKNNKKGVERVAKDAVELMDALDSITF